MEIEQEHMCDEFMQVVDDGRWRIISRGNDEWVLVHSMVYPNVAMEIDVYFCPWCGKELVEA